jgi:DNA-binding response OmpR family regulator
MRVLVVDDNPGITDALSFFFESNKMETKVINDSSKAVMEIKKENYDLVILDLAMPNFSGFDVIDSLKTEGLLRSQNIIIATAMPLSDTESKNLLSQEGIKHILRKPLSIEEMEEILRTFSDKMT